jgi:transposase
VSCFGDPRRSDLAVGAADGHAHGYRHGFGASGPHHAYVFSNRRGDRLKVLVHDGIGIWLAARRLHQGSFVRHGATMPQPLSRAQFDALVLGLPWHRIGEAGVITVL